MRTIVHLDLDCFFVSCERIKNPKLVGKPVIVGGSASGRGVVSSASYEARKFGVRSAMPTAQAKRLCPSGIFLSTDFNCYVELSKRVARFLNEVAPVVEQASIDEFYLDLTGCERVYPDLSVFGSFVKEYLKNEFKLPCTLAIASNKLVAKIAVGEAKPDGFLLIEAGQEAEFLRPLSIDAMPGIGKVTAKEMKALGLKTLGEIASQPESLLLARFGKWGRELKMLAQGIDDRPVVVYEDPKSIGRETTFGTDISDPEYLLSVLSSFVEECSAETREYGFKAKRVTVKFRLPDFTTFERSQTIAPTHSETEVFRSVRQLFLKNWKVGMKLRLVGASLSGFLRSREEATLFGDGLSEKEEKITHEIDRIRAKYGFEAIHRGSSLLGAK